MLLLTSLMSILETIARYQGMFLNVKFNVDDRTMQSRDSDIK